MADTVLFNGIKFRRYPESDSPTSRAYYTPGIGDKMRGFEVLHREVWKHHHGPIPDGFHIHHKDGDPLNNDIGNLECLSPEDHRAEHSEDRRSFARSVAGRAALEKARKAAVGWHKSDEGRAWHRELGRHAWSVREPMTLECSWCETRYEGYYKRGSGQYCSNGCKAQARYYSGVDDVGRGCECCGGGFTVNKYSKQRFCGQSCAVRHTARKSCDCHRAAH